MADISIRQVCKSFGKTEVVRGVDLEIINGEFIVILGPSGCGKSTILRMIAGLEEISSGEIAIAGDVVNELEPRERGCAMVFQNYALYPHMTVADNIGYSLKVAGLKRAKRLERVRSVAKIIGLEDYLDRKPSQLSGGQRQRVAMGRAIIREPKVFLFDEPLSNLDAKLRVHMRLEIRRLHQRLNATSVFVTHDQIEAMTLADRLVVMNSGQIEQVGTPSQVYGAPATTYVGAFLGSPPMNFLPGKIAASGAHVVLEDDQQLAIDPAFGFGRAGMPVEIGIRPEEVDLKANSQGNNLKTQFDFQEELGIGRLLHGRVGQHDFIVHAADKSPHAFGEEISIFVPAEAIHIFDGKTGYRLSKHEQASVIVARPPEDALAISA